MRAKYDAISVDAPPRIEIATDVCHIASILGESRGQRASLIPRTFLPVNAAPRAVVSAPMSTCRERATFWAMFVFFAVRCEHE